MSIMMALESGTSHPIAKAMVYYGEDRGYKGKAVELESSVMYQVKVYKALIKVCPYNLVIAVG